MIRHHDNSDSYEPAGQEIASAYRLDRGRVVTPPDMTPEQMGDHSRRTMAGVRPHYPPLHLGRGIWAAVRTTVVILIYMAAVFGLFHGLGWLVQALN